MHLCGPVVADEHQELARRRVRPRRRRSRRTQPPRRVLAHRRRLAPRSQTCGGRHEPHQARPYLDRCTLTLGPRPAGSNRRQDLVLYLFTFPRLSSQRLNYEGCSYSCCHAARQQNCIGPDFSNEGLGTLPSQGLMRGTSRGRVVKGVASSMGWRPLDARTWREPRWSMASASPAAHYAAQRCLRCVSSAKSSAGIGCDTSPDAVGRTKHAVTYHTWCEVVVSAKATTPRPWER